MKFTRFKILGVFILALLLMLSIGCKKTPSAPEVLQQKVTFLEDTIKEKKQEIEELKKKHKDEVDNLNKQHQEEMERMKTALANRNDVDNQVVQTQLNEAEKKLNAANAEKEILINDNKALKAKIEVLEERPNIEQTRKYKERTVFIVLIIALILILVILIYKYNRQSELLRGKAEFVFETTLYNKELSNE